MAKIANGQVIDILTLSKIDAEIGDYQWSHLDEALINAEKLGVWYPVDGRSSVGTAFQALTGQENVPNALDEGTFLRQAKGGREPGTFEADENKSHKHELSTSDAGTSGMGNASATMGGSNGAVSLYHYGGDGKYYQASDSDAYRAKPTGGPESRPKNIALNLYVKVDY